MNKLLYFSLSLTVISVGLLSMQQHEGPDFGPVVELVSSDGQAFPLPKSAAELSPTLQTILSGETHEQAEQCVALGLIDGKILAVVAKVLIALNEKIIEQELRPFPKSETIKHSIGDGYVTQNLQKLVYPILKESDIIQPVMLAFDFLGMPALVNATCKLFVEALLKKDPTQDLPAFMASAQELIPAGLLSYAEKHYLMQKAGIATELSIADYITLNGVPKINKSYYLDLSNKALTSLDGIKQIPQWDKIHDLGLNNNRLTSLPPEAFRELTNLTGLGLNINKLSSLPSGIFQALTNLKYLALSENKLSLLPSEVFQGLKNLRTLWLNNNQLASLPHRIFQELTNLYVLNLDYNQLSSLSSGIFHELTNLHGLGLSSNQLSSLPVGIFHELTNLLRLSLNNNFFSETQEAFRQQQELPDTVQIDWAPQRSLPIPAQ